MSCRTRLLRFLRLCAHSFPMMDAPLERKQSLSISCCGMQCSSRRTPGPSAKSTHCKLAAQLQPPRPHLPICRPFAMSFKRRLKCCCSTHGSFWCDCYGATSCTGQVNVHLWTLMAQEGSGYIQAAKHLTQIHGRLEPCVDGCEENPHLASFNPCNTISEKPMPSRDTLRLRHSRWFSWRADSQKP